MEDVIEPGMFLSNAWNKLLDRADEYQRGEMDEWSTLGWCYAFDILQASMYMVLACQENDYELYRIAEKARFNAVVGAKRDTRQNWEHTE